MDLLQAQLFSVYFLMGFIAKTPSNIFQQKKNKKKKAVSLGAWLRCQGFWKKYYPEYIMTAI
jgi:hypothetical protein